MKKFICILTAFILSISLFACNNEPTVITQDTIDKTIEQGEPNEINITEAKKYLEANYDTFNIDGSTSMIPLHQSLNDLFSSDEEPVQHSKTVDAFEKLVKGETDILIGVDYSDELLEKAKNKGIELIKKEITREAFVFLINKNNPVQSLIVEQIKDIYSGKITNWSEVGGDDAPIQAFQRNSDSGSQIRMNKFMGDTELMENDVVYISHMGTVVEQISNYDEGRYSIAYNMYTFTEKQYTSDEVILLAVNGVYPDDESIFDETYPIIIYNYIYYDANNAPASEFADNLYHYLMDDEGQKLISDSGYVNLNIKYDRNKDIDKPVDDYYTYVDPYDGNISRSFLGFYNEIKGEFYHVDYETEKVLVFNNFADYVLRDSEYKDNQKARDFLTDIFDSDIPINPNTARGGSVISLYPWFDGSLDADDFFNYKYDNMYYDYFEYYVDEDKYVLTAAEKDIFDSYMVRGWFDDFAEYADKYVPDAMIEITKDDLINLYFRTFQWARSGDEITFFQPFQ